MTTDARDPREILREWLTRPCVYDFAECDAHPAVASQPHHPDCPREAVRRLLEQHEEQAERLADMDQVVAAAYSYRAEMVAAEQRVRELEQQLAELQRNYDAIRDALRGAR